MGRERERARVDITRGGLRAPLSFSIDFQLEICQRVPSAEQLPPPIVIRAVQTNAGRQARKQQPEQEGKHLEDRGGGQHCTSTRRVYTYSLCLGWRRLWRRQRCRHGDQISFLLSQTLGDDTTYLLSSLLLKLPGSSGCGCVGAEETLWPARGGGRLGLPRSGSLCHPALADHGKSGETQEPWQISRRREERREERERWWWWSWPHLAPWSDHSQCQCIIFARGGSQERKKIGRTMQRHA